MQWYHSVSCYCRLLWGKEPAEANLLGWAEGVLSRGCACWKDRGTMAPTAPSPGGQRSLPPPTPQLSHNSVSTRQDAHQLAANRARPGFTSESSKPLGDTAIQGGRKSPPPACRGPTVPGHSGGAINSAASRSCRLHTPVQGAPTSPVGLPHLFPPS